MKRGIVLAAAVIMAVCLLGCGTWVRMDIQKEKATSIFHETNYRIGQTSTAFVGGPIVKVKSFEEDTEIRKVATSDRKLSIDARYKANFYHIENEAGREYPVAGKVSGGQEFFVVPLNDTWGILVSDDGSVSDKMIYNLYYRMVFYPSSISMTGAQFKIFGIPSPPARDIRTATPGPSFELIYSGKNDVSLNAVYREYTPNDLARPAFTQNVTYQADAKQMRFRDFVIRIDDASNEKIVYTVLEDGLN